ncbi:MAG: cytochrome c assembly protein [Gemmatimonadetes bacterium]|nr:cytochrome c assembly protein [Gemmatimonadota bacterium]
MTAPFRGTTPQQRDPQALVAKPIFDWFFAFAVVAVIVLYVRALAFTPPDALQGLAQKIYYVHIAAWLGAYTAIGITALMSIVYLWLHDERADRLGEASAEVGLVFLTVGLTTGTIWAHRIWGAWWVWWDMRLTLTLFLWFIVAAYLVLRGGIEDPGMRGRYSAVLAVLAALLIPFIHLSVYLFSARLHPMPVALQPGRPKMSPEMLTTFLGSFVAFIILCIALIRARYRLGVLRDIASAAEIDGDAR